MNVSKKSLREIVFNQIRDDICNGRINAGEKLSEAELAKKFSVSRTPVREALLQLEKEGYIVHTKHAGAVVRKISSKKLQEVYEILGMLEGGSIEQVVAGEVSQKDISFLEKLHNQMIRLSKEKNYIEFFDYNFQFHNFFLQQHGNETLMEMAIDLRRKIFTLVPKGLSIPMHIDTYIKSHKNIIIALKQKNSKKAKKLMMSHIKDTANALCDEMSKPSSSQF